MQFLVSTKCLPAKTSAKRKLIVANAGFEGGSRAAPLGWQLLAAWIPA